MGGEDNYFNKSTALHHDHVADIEKEGEHKLHEAPTPEVMSLETDMKRLQEPFRGNMDIQDFVLRTQIIKRHMGSMALTRGKLGEKLREAGALDSVMTLIHMAIRNHRPHLLDTKEVEILLICALGALRDLACGNSLNRVSIGKFTIEKILDCGSTQIDSGVDIICSFVKIHHGKSWMDILCASPVNEIKEVDRCCVCEPTECGLLQLKMLTAAVGVIRNISHSTKSNCEALHSCGMTEVLVWRLMDRISDESNLNNNGMSLSRLPDSAKPWREASFRIASSLINMAEKSVEVAKVCATDDNLISMLIESWGGVSVFSAGEQKKAFPVLHIGLINVLKLRLERESENNEGTLNDMIKLLLERETIRKKAAQFREEQRKGKDKKPEVLTIKTAQREQTVSTGDKISS